MYFENVWIKILLLLLLLLVLLHAICDIVKENHSQTIKKRLHKHGSESPALCSFNEGDIVYCHFPSKTIIFDLKLPSKKLQMSFVGLLYIYSKEDKFIYLLSAIDGEVIEQMLHVSHLKRRLLRLPNGKSVRNINDYKLEMICQIQMYMIVNRYLSKLCYIFTLMNIIILVKTQIHQISGVNLLQFSRTLFWTEGTIYCIFIIHITVW